MTIQQIGAGCSKIVYEIEQNPDLAFYIPRQMPLLTRFLWEPELKKEVEKTKKIKDDVLQANRSTQHLAVDLTLSPFQIKGQYTVQTPKASGDMEQEITRKDLSFHQRLNLCSQSLEGFSALHAAGWIHRDIKPENMLVCKKGNETTVQLSDWGKAKRQNPNDKQTQPYYGNARFAPPEYRSSYQSETYALGLVLLRILEEAILSQSSNQEMVIDPPSKHTFSLEKNMRGVIKYIYSSFYWGPKWFRRLVAWIDPKIEKLTKRKEKNQELTYTYMDALAKKLVEHQLCSEKVAQEINTLIKQMIQYNPNQRPTSQHAYETFQSILAHYQKETSSCSWPQWMISTIYRTGALFSFSRSPKLP